MTVCSRKKKIAGGVNLQEDQNTPQCSQCFYASDGSRWRLTCRGSEARDVCREEDHKALAPQGVAGQRADSLDILRGLGASEARGRRGEIGMKGRGEEMVGVR